MRTKAIKWGRKLTVITMIVLFVLIIAYDILIFVEPTEGDTISEVTMGWTRRYISLTVALGALLGHLVWPQRTPIQNRGAKILALVGIEILIIAWDIYVNVQGGPWAPDWLIVVTFFVSFFLGRFLWPQYTPRTVGVP